MSNKKQRSKNGEGGDVTEESTVTINPEILARFRPAESMYITKRGYTITFRPISAGVLDRVQQRLEEATPAPTPPDMELDHGKGRVSIVPNTKDEWFILQHSRWLKGISRDLAAWVFGVGVEQEPPPEDEVTPTTHAVFYGQLALETPDTLKKPYLYKYLWISSLLDSEEYEFLFEAIIGQASITKAGLQEAAEDFPG